MVAEGRVFSYPDGRRQRRGDDLTEKQRAFFDFVDEYCSRYGDPPTYAQLKQRFGLKTQGAVFSYVKALQRKGYLVPQNDGDWIIKVVPPQGRPDYRG